MASKVTCSNCGWSWNKSDSSKKDMYVCHQCGRDNSNKSEGWLDKYDDGGTMQEYQENYNDHSVSAPEEMQGDGYSNVGRDYSPAWGGQFQGGGFLQPTSDKLPEGYVIPYNTPSTELSMSIGGGDGEPAYLIPSFKGGRKLKDPIAEYIKTGEHLGGPFKTLQEAEKFGEMRHKYVEKGQDIPSPIKTWGDMAMGGSLPGSVGFTYARTGNIPSNGKYAKKTLASAQNGNKTCPKGFVNIDGECIETDSDKYMDMLDKGQVGTMKDDVFYGNKSELRPVTIFSTKDKDTQEFYDKLKNEGYSEKYNALIKLGQEYGFPKVSLKDAKNNFDLTDINFYNNSDKKDYRPNYDYSDDRMNLDKNKNADDLVDDYLSELAHHVQGKNEGALNMGLREATVIGRTLKNSLVNFESPNKAYRREYGLAGSIENEAHSEIEPKLKEKFSKNHLKELYTSDYYEMPGTFYMDKPNTKYKKGGVVKDDMGYWNPDNHGKVVEIDSNDITMEGVNQPLLGISDEGDQQYMTPGNNYKFKGTKVREYPMAKNMAKNGKRQEQKGLINLDDLLNFTNYNIPKAYKGMELSTTTDTTTVNPNSPENKKKYGSPDEKSIDQFYKDYYNSPLFKKNIGISESKLSEYPNITASSDPKLINSILAKHAEVNTTYNPDKITAYDLGSNVNLGSSYDDVFQDRGLTYAHEKSHINETDILKRQPKMVDFLINKNKLSTKYDKRDIEEYNKNYANFQDEYSPVTHERILTKAEGQQNALERLLKQKQQYTSELTHDNAPTEIRADIMGLRYAAAQAGIWDPTKPNAGNFTPEMLQKLYKLQKLNLPMKGKSRDMYKPYELIAPNKESLRKSNLPAVDAPKSPGLFLDRTRQRFDDSDLLYLMNNLAQNQSPMTSEMTTGKDGAKVKKGWLEKYN